ncbi:hypothetical protein ACWT_6275 [Actinoplanes sp. SE50]|uniref:hypothetical protein n=1 Tax=unclassified Actinoplanes TaxID=2626549 RepID=UPI00023ED2F6|nr:MULTISPECIES: hypothetical protein [unclassified Actinoplanes]AEV87290.1 hypothetical protein ACPL_6408 [Actinoplanes sp. SE50/110]ATO85690.1 hypothetical protein ACWT_6275 [Actinoplanes sp. SE50]SLM03103.1 hypothetical protein ACSP50_6392 [Actinoplanes sp. SE50/110]
MDNQARKLSTGSTVGGRIFGAAFGLVFAGAGVLFAAADVFADSFDPFRAMSDCVTSGDVAGIPADALPSGVTTCDWLHEGLTAFQIAGLLAGGLFALVGLLIVVASVRGSAAWLDGSRLRVRRTFGTRVVDLATADVTAGIVTHTDSSDSGPVRVRRVPTLVAREPATGRKVTLALQGISLDRLPPVELRALADAIVIGRPESDVDAFRVAEQLRAMADDPLELHRH